MTLNAISRSSPLYEAGKNSSASSCSGLLAEIRTPSDEVINLMPLYFSLDKTETLLKVCLLYTSDAADELDGVDLGGRRII